MKKNFIFLAMIFMTSVLFAKIVSVNLQPDTGIFFGNVREYVFLSDDFGGRKLSQLDWKITPHWYTGTKARITLFDLFFLQAEGKLLGIHGRSGSMIDLDWQNVQYHPESDWITDKSIHDNYINYYADSRFAIGCIFDLPLFTKLELNTSTRFQTFEFSSRNGTGHYGNYDWKEDIYLPVDKNFTAIQFGGDVISYSHKRFFLDLGLKASTTILPYMYFSTFLDVSIFSKIDALDTHHMREIYFADSFTGFGEFNFGTEVFIIFGRKKNMMSGFSAICQYIPTIKGKETSKTFDSNTWEKEDEVLGGTDSFIFMISASFSYSF